MKDLRVHREELPASLADALLDTGSDLSAGSRLLRARDEMVAAVESATRSLGQHALTEIVAEHAARKAGRRGDPRIVVDADGRVMLEIHYTSGRGPKLGDPSLMSLRKEAESLGVDPAPFGRSRKKILAAMEEARTPAPKPPLKPSILVDDDDDLDALFGDSPTPMPVSAPKLKPKPRPTPKQGATPPKGALPTRSGPSLSAIVGSDVDIDAILAKPIPPIPKEEPR